MNFRVYDRTMEKNNLVHRELKPMQEKFCVEWVKGCYTYEEAYLKAGYKKNKYSKQSAKNLFDKPHIQKRIYELRKIMENDSIADLMEIKRFLTRTIRQETEEEVLMSEGVEKGITETVRYKKKADIRCALKACDQLVRMLGGYDDKLNLGGAAQIIIKDDLED